MVFLELEHRFFLYLFFFKINVYSSIVALGFPGVSVVKNMPVNAGFDSRVRKIPREGNGNPF